MNKLVGKKIRQARLSKGISIEKVSRDTHIRTRHIEALEAGDFGSLPSAAQVRGFLRIYTDYLNIDAKELFSAMHQADKQTLPIESPSNPEIEQESENQHNIDPAEEIKAIFNEISSAIQQRREGLGLSLEEIENHTHIPARYLNLIEEGNFSQFPSPTQARGMLGSYAKFLDMDTNAVLLRYAEALQYRLRIQHTATQTPMKSTKKTSARGFDIPLWLRKFLSADVLVFSSIGLVVVIFAVWGIGHVLDTRSEIQPQPTAPPLAQVLLPATTEAPTPTGTVVPTDEPVQPDAAADEVAVEEDIAVEQPAIEATLPPFSGENIQVYIVVRQRTYMRVTVDGEVQFDGRVNIGGNYPFTGQQSIEVLSGNGAALQVFVNDVDLGPLGIFGEVVNVIYTREGALTPTPKITPTQEPGQITPSPSASPTEEA